MTNSSLCVLFMLACAGPAVAQRDALRSPFSAESIWNTPIGSDAVYVNAQLEGGRSAGLTVDEDLIVMRPFAPLVDVLITRAGWDRDRDRCMPDGGVLFSAPIPKGWTVGPNNWDGSTPNGGMAVLMPDGRTILQTQPFSWCDAGRPPTSEWMFDPVDLYGPGTTGAHGGSGLSAIGGALRIGELRPGTGPIRHTIKINLFAARNLFYDETTRGRRWPAPRSDSYAADVYGSQRTGVVVEACRMGALLALPPSVDIEALAFETEPGRLIAQAMQDYGAYVVDDTYWDVFALVCEWGPDGRFTEQFERDWGFPFIEFDQDTPWARDMGKIYERLHVVDNNGPGHIGGGGLPRVERAPPLTPPAAAPSNRPNHSP